MTNVDKFILICNHYFVHPAIAMESERIREAMRKKDFELIAKILEEEF